MSDISFIDLFCGIGGFHAAMDSACRERGIEARCVMSSDIDPDARRAYKANFNIMPQGDITRISAADIPDHEMLFAGFPCQSFSCCGLGKGFEDARGTLFFDVARILEAKQPSIVVLENVRNLVSHDGGKTIAVIMQTLKNLGYHAQYKVLNALDFGVPQLRRRIFIVGFLYLVAAEKFVWPEGGAKMRPLEELLEADADVPSFYFASKTIQSARQQKISAPQIGRSVWHENKAGNIGVHPYSCALRAGASYNYLLVDGKRRFTEREMLRLQGFPEDYKVVCGYGATRKQCGNSVAVPCVAAVIRAILEATGKNRDNK